MPRITLADLTAEPTTIEMFEHTYRVNSITRSVQKQLEKVQPLIENLKDEDDGDKVIAAIAGAIDALLRPEDGAPPAKRVILDAWKADQVSLDVVSALFDKVQEASVSRPT